MSFAKTVLPALVLTAVLGLGAAPAQSADAAAPAKAVDAAAPLTKDDVEKIVHDYIVKNPKVILEAVDDYQKTYMEQRSAEGMKKHKEALVSDEGSPETGNPKGDVTMVEFFDYNCGFCKAVQPSIDSLLEKDKDLRIVFKEFPILGPSSEDASRWALAANKQKKYFAFHQALMKNKEPISDARLTAIAKEVGIDADKARADAQSAEITAAIDKNRALASDLGINGTPAFVIGSDISRGAVSLAIMEKKIADARAAAKKGKDKAKE